ncbi:MAG: zinc-binding dehydrogenase [Chloroflexi bacterium]|nr:zinc-binding dehydrogenase [Chloroflexota bacterium]
MKAAIFYKRGGIENLRFDEVPTPKVGAHDVLVKMRACGLNHLDIFTREGSHGVHAPLPHIGGLETVGEIAELGKDVSREAWKIRDRVLVGSAITCGKCEYCTSGNDNICPKRKVFGVNVWGGFAEYIKVPASILVGVPDSLSFVQAAASPSAFGTAWHMLITRAKIQPGEWVLVLAAGSSVGVAGIQVAKHFGCKVIATASTDEKLAKAKEIGADYLVNYTQKNFAHEVLHITENRGVDVVFEHVGTSTWEKSIASLRPTGRLVTCGSTTGRWGNTDVWSTFFKQISILGSYGWTAKEFFPVWDLIGKSVFHPIIDRTFPLAETATAQQYIMDRKQFGKVLVVD